MRRWIEAGVVPQPTPVDEAVPTRNQVPAAASQSDQWSSTTGDPSSSHTHARSLSITKLPAPLPVNAIISHSHAPVHIATSVYAECPALLFELFVKTGDAGDADIDISYESALPPAATGSVDALPAQGKDKERDMRSYSMMDWYGNQMLHNTPFTNITIEGSPIAAVQNVDNFSFTCALTLPALQLSLPVWPCGGCIAILWVVYVQHALQSPVAFEIFKQVIAKEQLHSV
ncbi:hypothetical protein JB92DRAFT_2827776 [Gautieria morchelliformis]|nr:hypothetical protein JB92DRAFT_2827776 [Gautieria morchelliformis]